MYVHVWLCVCVRLYVSRAAQRTLPGVALSGCTCPCYAISGELCVPPYVCVCVCLPVCGYSLGVAREQQMQFIRFFLTELP